MISTFSSNEGLSLNMWLFIKNMQSFWIFYWSFAVFSLGYLRTVTSQRNTVLNSVSWKKWFFWCTKTLNKNLNRAHKDFSIKSSFCTVNTLCTCWVGKQMCFEDTLTKSLSDSQSVSRVMWSHRLCLLVPWAINSSLTIVEQTSVWNLKGWVSMCMCTYMTHCWQTRQPERYIIVLASFFHV